MRKKLAFFAALTILLMLNTNAGLLAQASGNEQRLVGTWTSLLNPDLTVVLNANGTISGFSTPDAAGRVFSPTHWAAADDKIIFYIPLPNDIRIATRDFRISSDGRTLIIIRRVINMDTGDQEAGIPLRRN